MKKIAAVIGGALFVFIAFSSAQASDDEWYEHGGGYGYGNGYMYNDDMYEYGRARVIMPPTYGNVVPAAPATVYPPANVSNYRAAVPYYGHEAYEHSGGYGYYDDDSYKHRGGYWREHH